MSDLPSIAILQQINARPMSGEDLETFGKEAASRYVSGRCPNLTEAVVETVKSAGLAPEQVRRVVEFANTDAFLQEFKKEGHHKVVEFAGGPANYADVLRDLNDGGGGTVFDRGNTDYDLPPPDMDKTSQIGSERLGLENQKLAQAFQVDEKPLPFADPLKDAFDMKVKLAAAYDELTGEVSALEVSYYETGDRLFNQVKQAALGGMDLGQIVQAWHQVVDEPEYVKAAFQQLAPRLVSNGVFRSKSDIGDSLLKTAQVGVVNKEHPLVIEFMEFCSTLNKLAQANAVREEVVNGLDQISNFLKIAQGTAIVGGGMAGKGANIAKKVWTGAKGLAESAAPHAEAAGEWIGGERTGKALGWGVRHLPHAAVGLGAEEAYQRARYSPTLQTVRNFLMSRVPYTRENLIRQYSLQH